MVARGIAAALVALCLAGTALAAGEAPLSPEAQELFDQAFEALDADRPAQALPLYERALELAPDSWRIWVEYASCLRELNRQPAAARAGWRTVQLSPAKEAGGWVNLGNVLSRAWRFEEAAAAYEEALEADGDKVATSRRFTSLGYFAEHAGRRDAALRFYERALALDPRNAVAMADRGRMLHCLGGSRAEESAACFEKAQKLAQKQKDKEALAYTLDTLFRLNGPGACRPWQAEPSHQPLPEALLTRPQGDARQIPLPVTVERRWLLPDGKTASLVTPEAWEERALDAGGTGAVYQFIAKFEPPQSYRWDLSFSPTAETEVSTSLALRPFAESLAGLARPSAVETEVVLHGLEGPSCAGWYFTLTDKSMVGKPAAEGQFLYLTQAILESGGQRFVCTLLSHTKEPADLEPVLRALATLKVQ